MKRWSSPSITLGYGKSKIDSGNNYVDVAHGLGGTPTAVNITPADGCEAPIQVPAASLGATTFRVQFIGGLTLGSDANFYWMVS